MTLSQLEYIVAVFVYGSFSEAANHCFVTQPTLSMQIQKLEDELGLIIFDRIGLVYNKIFIRKHLIKSLRKKILNSIPQELLKIKNKLMVQ